MLQEDMGRSEQLSAKYKTLSYDHERLIEQHRAARDAAAQAEREMETGKAKVDSAQKRLTAEEEKHKKSRDDHQRLKMAMQYLRTTTANEVKRKEKEVEKMADRWAKISNEQVRLGSVGAGLACANLLPQAAVSEVSRSPELKSNSDCVIGKLPVGRGPCGFRRGQITSTKRKRLVPRCYPCLCQCSSNTSSFHCLSDDKGRD